MNQSLKKLFDFILQNECLSADEKKAFSEAIKEVDKELAVAFFKLDRTEKVKRTTLVLLKETIDELEKKRADVVQANEALRESLEELKAAQAQLIQSEKMASLGELTAGIAHEIQNPLNFVNNFSEVNSELCDELEKEITSGKLQEIRLIAKDLKENEQKIKFHGKRAEAIIKAMLLHSRGSNGKMEPVDINALVNECLRLSYHGFKAKDKSFHASFLLDVNKSLPKINAIPQGLGRVLLNLFNNAFYAVNEKSKVNVNGYKPEVVVSTNQSASPEGKEKIEIHVRDNGSGIPENIKEKIFQPFFTTKPLGQGTGLGLSLSYDIVKAYGGEIVVESREGEGTEFKIKIPLKS